MKPIFVSLVITQRHGGTENILTQISQQTQSKDAPMKRHHSYSGRTGLTRIEVVVLIIVIFVMLTLLFPFINWKRDGSEHGHAIHCLNNMKQLGLAMNIMATMRGNFPPAQRMDTEGKIQYGWRIALLAYLEEPSIYEKIMNNLPWDNEQNKQFENVRLSPFVCPGFGDLQPGRTSYQVIVGPGTPFEGNRCSTYDDFERGLSHTILIAETSQGLPWMEPVDLPYTNLDHGVVPISSKHWSIGSGHRGHGAHVIMADASVQTLVFSNKPNNVAMLKQMTWLKATYSTPEKKEAAKEVIPNSPTNWSFFQTINSLSLFLVRFFIFASWRNK